MSNTEENDKVKEGRPKPSELQKDAWGSKWRSEITQFPLSSLSSWLRLGKGRWEQLYKSLSCFQAHRESRQSSPIASLSSTVFPSLETHVLVSFTPSAFSEDRNLPQKLVMWMCRQFMVQPTAAQELLSQHHIVWLILIKITKNTTAFGS